MQERGKAGKEVLAGHGVAGRGVWHSAGNEAGVSGFQDTTFRAALAPTGTSALRLTPAILAPAAPAPASP